MLKEFREFVMRGNVMDLAVAVIIGGAFGKIITSLVNDMLMPLIGHRSWAESTSASWPIRLGTRSLQVGRVRSGHH